MHDGPRFHQHSNNVWKRVKNGSLRYPYLPSYDLLRTKELHGNTPAEKHYEMQLFDALSWLQVSDRNQSWLSMTMYCKKLVAK